MMQDVLLIAVCAWSSGGICYLIILIDINIVNSTALIGCVFSCSKAQKGDYYEE